MASRSTRATSRPTPRAARAANRQAALRPRISTTAASRSAKRSTMYVSGYCGLAANGIDHHSLCKGQITDTVWCLCRHCDHDGKYTERMAAEAAEAAESTSEAAETTASGEATPAETPQLDKNADQTA